jgi:hypothetical protein
MLTFSRYINYYHKTQHFMYDKQTVHQIIIQVGDRHRYACSCLARKFYKVQIVQNVLSDYSCVCKVLNQKLKRVHLMVLWFLPVPYSLLSLDVLLRAAQPRVPFYLNLKMQRRNIKQKNPKKQINLFSGCLPSSACL